MWRLRFAYWRGADPVALAASYADVREDRRQQEVEANDAKPRAATSAQRMRTPDPRAQAPRASLPMLQVFAKAPVPGAVKTRLARTIGPAAAAAVHVELVERMLATAAAARSERVVADVELWCAPDAGDPAFVNWRDRYLVTLRTQEGRDLGARMRHALDSALRAGHSAILVGCDCPLLDIPVLAQAARALADHDAVVGPAEDGGYVLIGLSRSVDAFTGVGWGEPGVMAATRTKLVALGATWSELPMLWDVDEAPDLARWRPDAAGGCCVSRSGQ
jgi:hypothetical protein